MDSGSAEVLAWCAQEAEKEAARLRGLNERPLVVASRAFRSELDVDTAFNFDNVVQILLSEPQECPLVPGLSYVNLLCLINKPIFLLVPFLFDAKTINPARGRLRNKLKDFQVTNIEGVVTHLRVGEFSDVDDVALGDMVEEDGPPAPQEPKEGEKKPRRRRKKKSK